MLCSAHSVSVCSGLGAKMRLMSNVRSVAVLT